MNLSVIDIEKGYVPTSLSIPKIGAKKNIKYTPEPIVLPEIPEYVMLNTQKKMLLEPEPIIENYKSKSQTEDWQSGKDPIKNPGIEVEWHKSEYTSEEKLRLFIDYMNKVSPLK